MLAVETFEGLRSTERVLVLRAVSVVYLVGLNGLLKIKVERNCYDQVFDAVPVYTPLDLVKTSTVDFVRIVSKHKPRILHSFDEQMLLIMTHIKLC